MDQDLEFLHSEVDSLSWHLNRHGGIFTRLNRQIAAGRYIHPETTEALRLLNDANLLRSIADEMLRKRNALIANMPSLQAAE